MNEKILPIDEFCNSINTEKFKRTIPKIELLAERRTMHIIKNIVLDGMSMQEMLIAAYIQGLVDSQLVKEQ